MSTRADEIINGTWGECSIDGEKLMEIKQFKAEIALDKEEVKFAGKMGTDTKIKGFKGTGTVKVHKINSNLMNKIAEKIKLGINPSFKILSELVDPASKGAERIVVKDAKFDKVNLADWEVGNTLEEEYAFTFSDYEIKDTIK